MKRIRVGSRDSKLAKIQAMIVIEQIKKTYPDFEIELITMKTTGDLFLDRSLDKIGGKGLFIKELDQALLDKKIDIAVHSLKDMPMELTAGLPIIAYTKRADERDVLILPNGYVEWDMSKPVGCSSFRRRVQLNRLYPGIEVKPVRGNVLTRLEKLDKGEFGALVLAAAGMKRLGLEERIHHIFSPEQIIPAAGQGVLAIQGRAAEDYDYLDAVNDPEAQSISIAERAFVRCLDGGCSSPVAAYGRLEGENIVLQGLYYDEKMDTYITDIISGRMQEAEHLGCQLADRLEKKGKRM